MKKDGFNLKSIPKLSLLKLYLDKESVIATHDLIKSNSVII